MLFRSLSRMRMRPESAVMVILPAFVLLALRHARAVDAGEPRAWRWGVALVALEALWAQVHPGFIIALAAWGAVWAPAVVTALRSPAAPTSRAALAHVAGVGVALVLTAGSGAHGFAILAQWRAHAGGDAVRHIGDMQAPPAAFFDPREIGRAHV